MNMLTADWTTGLITLDGEPTALAQYNRNERWNGFLCPSFDALTVVEVLEGLNESYGSDAPTYGMEWDWNDEGALVLTERLYRDEEGEAYRPEVILPDADGLYSLGAYGWVWCELHPEW